MRWGGPMGLNLIISIRTSDGTLGLHNVCSRVSTFTDTGNPEGVCFPKPRVRPCAHYGGR